MFLKEDLYEFKQDFINIGVANEDTMLEILNGLDQIAEAGYDWYKGHNSKNTIS